MLKRIALGAVTAGMVAFAATGAQAAILLDDWQFDARGQDGLPGGPGNTGEYFVPAVDSWTFLAAFVQNIIPADAADGLDVGDQGIVNGRGRITSMEQDGNDVTPFTLNENPTVAGFSGFEVTFEFIVDFEITDVNPGDANFKHLAATNATGELKIFIDNLDQVGAVNCNVNTALGCTDGEHVATFDIQEGDGGTIIFGTGNGSDDATFEASFLKDGVWFDKNGNSLACNDANLGEECGPNGTLAFTDSNLDSDPNANGLLDTDITDFDCGIDPQTGVSAPTRSCGREDGSLVLATVPEPGTLAMFSFGFLALGGYAARRRRSR